MQQGIPWYRFTKNFQDAIEIARFLEVGYIWIDSLCKPDSSIPLLCYALADVLPQLQASSSKAPKTGTVRQVECILSTGTAIAI